MTSQQTPLTTRRLRAGIAGLGLVLGLTLAGCSSPAADDAVTPTPSASASASAEAASPTPEATTEGDAGSGDAAAPGSRDAIAAKTRDIACGLKDKSTLEESDVQAFRDLGTEISASTESGAAAAGQQITALADQLAPGVGQPISDELKTQMSSACDSLQ
ncbi:hypothetical protein ACR8AL_11160 [Clavibacter sepedonicus]|uniref:Exported protein n=1 Tax=Clavibacter sepedonicus TaxID=31964 RepID=B0RGQ1_CLASE|nr:MULTISPECIES: hypothetical protein [Clavibacter]MBD5380424.1 hypothetical protein [Clavibacter sp.]OQJ48046.1 hypothetical protein B5P19_06945 [Clavibacter sepedonicus]OQJ53600.1 hypothetical protein B5P20_05195 [Clavibacter sepedonicus]UUK66290.1 hypothetical protein LRE50_03445 [Clavibacter sepedonicus]CAQ02458.1 putative exported protein [Clavibacter sepedonicus]